MNPLHFAVIGGDMRQVKLAELLVADGHKVTVLALEKTRPEGAESAKTPREAVAGADCVVLPLPITSKDLIVNTPLGEGGLTTDQVFSAVSADQMVCAGRIGGEIYEQAASYGIRLSDYYAREELVIANAVATAEGAIQLAMEETPTVLSGSRCLVIGFGRIGKVLAHRLRGLGALVTVSARNYADLAWIDAYGYTGVNTNELDGRLSGYDILFNTVPHRVLGENRLRELGPDTLCIDLSSKPGGMDFLAASSLGLKAIWALGLPGEVAPVTSGVTIRDTIYNILREQGRNQ